MLRRRRQAEVALTPGSGEALSSKACQLNVKRMTITTHLYVIMLYQLSLPISNLLGWAEGRLCVQRRTYTALPRLVYWGWDGHD
jgi:hypothetical protein